MGLTVDILIGNDLESIMPLTVSVANRASTETSNTQNVVCPGSTNVKSARSSNDVVNVLVDNDHATNENELVDWENESDTNDVVATNMIALVDQDEDLASDCLQMTSHYYIMPQGNIVTRIQLIEMQHADTSSVKIF